MKLAYGLNLYHLYYVFGDIKIDGDNSDMKQSRIRLLLQQRLKSRLFLKKDPQIKIVGIF